MSAPLTGHRVPVRYREDAFEMRCSMCGDWWPLGLEFWQPHSGMQRCRACHREYQRIWAAAKNEDAAHRKVRGTRDRLRRASKRQELADRSAAWRVANPDRVRENRRRYYHEHREEELAKARAYSAKYRKRAA